ncbi:Serine/threonine-protein kinase Sgk2, partial [Dispira parvispora]
MQPMPAALKQLLAKGDPITLGSLFNQARQRRQQPQGSPLPPPPPTLTAYIVATETKSEEGSLLKKYTAYKVLVSRGTAQHWITKRYSDFDQLHTRLTLEFPQRTLPTLPPKRLFGSNLSTEFVLARREQLNQYLDALLRHPDLRQTEIVKTFFEDWAITGVTPSLPSSFSTVPSDTPTGGNLWRNFRRRINTRRAQSSNPSLAEGEVWDKARDGNSEIPTPPVGESIKRRTSPLQFSRIKLGLTPRHLLGKRRKVYKSVRAEDKTPGPSGQNSSYDSDWLTADTAKLVYPKDHTTVEDFSLLKLIGKGGYGKVLLARHKNTGNVYAIKVISKSQLNTKPSNITRIMAERAVLERSIDHPFLVGLRYAFQTPEKLYFCIDYVNGGDLYFHLHQDRQFDEARARFYVAEITLALEYLHGMRIIYRDLKPENCLLDAEGHIRLVDFGLAKDMSNVESQRTSTICGTAEYLAPEVVLQQPYDVAVD